MGFLSRMLGSGKETLPSAVPPGQRVYAIGDIHGRDDLFAELLTKIDADDAARGVADTMLILLGDLIDRGPNSRAVVDRAITLSKTRQMRSLKGNHEEAFLQALSGDDQAMKMLLRVGGDATLISYGIPGLDVETLELDDLIFKSVQTVPQSHIEYMVAMEDRVAIGDYLFVHAGIRPGVPIDRQKAADLRWIRDDFLKHGKHHGLMIVHGHSIATEAELLPNRIGIDTGAYASGTLTALGLEGEERWLLQT